MPLRSSLTHREFLDSLAVIAENSTALTDLLDQNKIGVNDCDNDGNTLLHHAYARNNEHLIRYLEQRGADTIIMNNDGNLPVDMQYIAKAKAMMASAELSDLKRYLQDYSVNHVLNLRTGETLLHYAIKHGFLDAAKHLILHGADTTIKSNRHPLKEYAYLGGQAPLDYMDRQDVTFRKAVVHSIQKQKEGSVNKAVQAVISAPDRIYPPQETRQCH